MYATASRERKATVSQYKAIARSCLCGSERTLLVISVKQVSHHAESDTSSGGPQTAKEACCDERLKVR